MSRIRRICPVHSERSSNRNFFWMCCEEEEEEEEEQDAEELHAALGDLGDAETESVSSLSELRIFLFLQGVRLLSLLTSEAAALASWLGAGGLGEVLGQADVLLSTPSKGFTVPTDQPIWEETHPPTIPSSTKGSANAVTGIATTFEPYLPNDTTSKPALDISDATTVELTTPTSLQSTSSTMAPPSPEPTNATMSLPTPEPTNATMSLPTPEPTNATMSLPTPEP
ncbi:lysosome-associated membrane glycoprotein 2 isoform X1, partial [Tachysurus ichikawai]